MLRRLSGALLLPLLLQLACRAAERPPASAVGGSTPRAPTLDVATTHVSLERTPCFGWCPVYTVTLAPNGEVTFTASGREGDLRRRWNVPAVSVATLAREFAAAGFLGVSDVVPGSRACGPEATDHSTMRLQVSDAAQTHRVEYYTGCFGVDSLPAQVESLPGRLHAPHGVLGTLTRLAARVDTVSRAVPVLDSLRATEFFRRRRGA